LAIDAKFAVQFKLCFAKARSKLERVPPSTHVYAAGVTDDEEHVLIASQGRNKFRFLITRTLNMRAAAPFGTAVQPPTLRHHLNNKSHCIQALDPLVTRDGTDPVVAFPSRRNTLQFLLSLPLLATATDPSLSFPALAASGPRSLTASEAAAVQAAFKGTLPKTKAPVVLRLVFHDAATFDAGSGNGGINASIRFEKDRPENFGLNRGIAVIEATYAKLKGTPGEALSRADLIALAGAEAVRVTGGPVIDVPVGRLDAEMEDPQGRLPAETLSAPEQLRLFAAKGFNANEMIALLGSHTVSMNEKDVDEKNICLVSFLCRGCRFYRKQRVVCALYL